MKPTPLSPFSLSLFWKDAWLGKLSLVMLMSALMGVAPRASAEVLTLEDCIHRALTRSTSIDSQRGQQYLNELRTIEARKDFYPSLSGSWRQVNYRTKAVQENPGSFYADLFSRMLSANFRQPLYTGGRLKASLAGAKAAEDGDEYAMELTSGEIVLLVKQSYYSILQAQTELAINEEVVAQAKQSLEFAEKRLALGKSVKLELLSEKQFLLDAEMQLLSAKQALAAGKRSLRLLMEDDPSDTDFDVAPLPTLEKLTLAKDAVIDLSLRHRPELPNLDSQIRQQEFSLTAVRSKRKPSLSFDADYLSYFSRSFQRYSISVPGFPDQTFDSNQDFRQERWTIGLTSTWQPFQDATFSGGRDYTFDNSKLFNTTDNFSFSLNDGTSTKVTEESLQLTLRRLRRERATTALKLKGDVIKAFEDYEIAEISRESSEARIELAQEQERVEERRQELGLNTSKDVIDARAAEVQARLNLVRADYVLALAIAQIEYTAGGTLPEGAIAVRVEPTPEPEEEESALEDEETTPAETPMEEEAAAASSNE